MFSGSPAPADKVIHRQTKTIEDPDQDEGPETTNNEHASLAPSPTPTPTEFETFDPIELNPPLRSISTPSIHPNLQSPTFKALSHPLFSVQQLGADRRLLVNRKRQLKMYRVWMQGKFKKLPSECIDKNSLL